MKQPPCTFFAVEMFLLDPERAEDAAILLHAMPERPIVGLEGVAAPGAPAFELPFGADVQVGTVAECGLGKLVHGNRPSGKKQRPLNLIRGRCANPPRAWGYAKLWTGRKWAVKGLFRPLRSP